MGFKDIIIEELKGTLTKEELELLPRGFQGLGKIMIIKLSPELLPKKQLIGEACLSLHPSFKSIYLNAGKIKGTFRQPEQMDLIAGIDNPIADHLEHGVRYRFDITKIMFSKGNLSERKFLATLVKDDEVIVDMFAGIGYFSLPIAKNSNPKQIYSIELNPESYEVFVQNIKLNHLEEKITPIFGDSKIEVLKLSQKGITADRVIMGVFPAPKNFIKEALTLTSQKGTIFHYEGVTKKENYLTLYEEFEEITINEGYSCKLQSHRFVKGYGPHLLHVVVDILVSKTLKS